MSREQFEAWWEINYHNGNPPRFGWAAYREDGGYKIDDDESELDGMWQAWQAATKQTEAKCSALAAEKERFAVECAASKIAIAYLKSGRQDFSLNTPATDAFLAEVRAQGVELFFDENPAALGNGNIESLRESFLPKIKSGEIGWGDYLKRKDTDLQEATQ